MMGSDVVVTFLFSAFTCNELLAERLVGHVADNFVTSVCCFNSCLVSFLEVVIMGIFECAFVITEVQ